MESEWFQTFIAPQSVKEDDSVSVAGTVFNEPWDSNVWENLLDLAHYGAEKPSTLKRQHTDVAMPSCLGKITLFWMVRLLPFSA